ncbi:MAG: hypothetical protein ACOYZ8_15965 [Chloroflexota bacterium]
MSRPIYSLTDLVTWVGSETYPTVDDYIEEANSRGCCRRMPDLPEWVQPGATRVFLAHQGDQRPNSSRGVLFGYYLLGRIQVIGSDPFKDRIPSNWHPVWRRGVSHPSEPTIRRQFRRWLVTERYITLRRRKKGDVIDELLEELWGALLKELAKEAVEKLFEYFDPANLPYEPGRGCGGRTEGGIYLLDQKASDWSDWLVDFVAELFSAEEEEKKTKVARKKVIYHTHFTESDHPIPSARYRLHQGFSSNGKVCEECAPEELSQQEPSLILFKSPYPIYNRPPRALFRGYDRVDGDALLMKV